MLKAWHTHRNVLPGRVDFYPLLAKVSKASAEQAEKVDMSALRAQIIRHIGFALYGRVSQIRGCRLRDANMLKGRRATARAFTQVTSTQNGSSRAAAFSLNRFRVVDQLLAAMEVCGCVQPYDASWER
jgi:hypothetical protein